MATTPQNVVALACLAALSIILAGIAIFLSLRLSGPRQALEEWAVQGAFTIESARRRYLFCGPFTFSGTTAQLVYRIKVRDSHGTIHSGYARVGGIFELSNPVKVIWDR